MSYQLSVVASSGDEWAAERAKYVLQIAEAVASGQMSKEEATEVLQDMIATQQLQEQAQADQVKAALFFGITQLISMYV